LLTRRSLLIRTVGSTAVEKYWARGTPLRAYRSYPARGGCYFDDNCWVGSDLLQHHLLTTTGTSYYLTDATRLADALVQV